MSIATPSAATVSVAELRRDIKGRLITPDDAEYDKARTIFYAGVADARPAAIVRVADDADVARVVTLARASGIELAVRCGGHSFAGYSTTDGGIVLDLRDLRRLDIDADGRTAWADAGLTARDVSTALDPQGLAVGFGDTGSVGIGGITLGGGVGYLVRKYGLTIDSLLAADVVTADGQVRRVDAGTEPDLFWAIRGGGGNFGVATRFQYRLRELGDVVGGMLMVPATVDTVAGFIDALETAPEELSGIANVMPAMPMPGVPEDQIGRLVIFGLLVHAGDADAGERAMAPFRALATPVVDMLRPMRYPEIFPPDDEDYNPTAVARTMHLDHVDRPVAEKIVNRLESSDAAMRVAQLRVLGGAMARVPADATAYAHRKSRIMVNLAAFYESEEERALRQAWVDDFVRELDQGDSGVYSNFLGEEGKDLVRDAYPGATYDRLAMIKARYDPTNVFRRTLNIQPAAVESGA